MASTTSRDAAQSPDDEPEVGSAPRRTRSSRLPDGDDGLTSRQREILSFILDTVNTRGYPPSVREIGTAVGLTSPSTVHSHLASLQRLGFLKRDPSKPRAIEVHTGGYADVAERRPVTHIPLIGHVAAGTGVLADEKIEELIPLPSDFTGPGELFMVKVRGDSMINAGILDGDHVVARADSEVRNGDMVVAGLPGEEATIKFFERRRDRIALIPANPDYQEMVFPESEVPLFGRVVTVIRKL